MARRFPTHARFHRRDRPNGMPVRRRRHSVMLKGQFRYIAVAAFGAGTVLLASGAGSHLLALQGSSPTVRAHASDDLTQASPAPTLSPVPAATTTPANVAPVTVLAAAPALDDEATEMVED